ncbi:sialidase family protein [Dactylosporangium sp. CA-092794]|uniref:sialidase family protein n=1 Tax=Dactylosporangium sp. CA-092794 TaxID=3239929 RepID=UPI003D904F4A
MPDQLEARLRAERERLDIDLPPLSAIAVRAAALRRRRRAARAAVAALAAVALAGMGAAVAALRAGGTPPAPTAAASTAAPIWTADGITIQGLPHLPADLPGSVRSAEFLDGDRGFLLTGDPGDSGAAWISATTDGGRTWTTAPSPMAGRQTLVAGTGWVTLIGDAPDYPRASTTDGEHWTSAASPPGAAAALGGDARLVPLDAAGCGARTGSLAGTVLAEPPGPPGITACWWSPVRAGDGAWWVGGRTADGTPAVSVSRDGGEHWSVTAFPGFPATAYARAAMLGRDVYVTVVAAPDSAGAPERLLAVAASADGGVTFGPAHPTAGQATIGGDLVPLLDGRLLIVDGYGHWLVSADRGASWHRVEGLHATMRLARTEAGYLAYQMADIYTAFSVDGLTWQKLDAQ